MEDLLSTETIRIVVDPALVPTGDLEPLIAALSDFEPVLEAVGAQMAVWQQKNFAEQGAAFNAPWPALAPSTIAEKRRLGFPETPLVRTGRLRDSVGRTVLVEGDRIVAGIDLSEVPYAKYHQQGRGVPIRLLVALTADEMDDLLQMLEEFVAEALGHPARGIAFEVGDMALAMAA